MKNSFNGDFPERIVCVATSEEINSFTCDREEFIGINGSLEKPASLERVSLTNVAGVAYDPCVAIQIVVELDVGEEKEIGFLLGATKDREEIDVLIEKYRKIDNSKEALKRVKDYWLETLETIQVETPDLSMNIIIVLEQLNMH